MSPKVEKLVHCTRVCVPTVEKHYTILVLGLPEKKMTKILDFEGLENCIFDSVETGSRSCRPFDLAPSHQKFPRQLDNHYQNRRASQILCSYWHSV